MFALATDYHGESRNTKKLRQTLAAVAEAGFSHVHWCHEWRGSYLYSTWEMRQFKEWLEELGLKAKGVHASSGEIRSYYAAIPEYEGSRENLKDYVSFNEYNRRAGVELIKNRVDLAGELGTGEIVLHLHLPFRIFEADRGFKEKFWTAVFKSFDELRPCCLERRVKICVENLPDFPEHHQIEMFDRLFERYGPDFMGLCFDTGHGNITSENCLEFARRYIDRLFIVHIHDNHGAVSPSYLDSVPLIIESDEHRIPFEGTFDWEGFAEVLAASPYELPYLMEINMRDTDEAVFFRKVLEAGRRFHALMNRHRK
ncbi:MAG: sugar phosphate isomerase/epimerase [Treponema sp.]|jgi:sugar phosphate isomerase/epimerase|nr:sugar phosphate isomerase/epimerase [Treponema sp.]